MKKSIKTTVGFFTVLAMAILTVLIVMIGYFQFNVNVLENYIKYATLVTKESIIVIDEYKIGDLVENREMGEIYEAARLELNKIKNNSDIKYIYAICFDDINDLNTVSYIINAKTDEELSTGEPLEEIYSYMGERCEENAFTEEALVLLRQCILDGKKEIQYFESHGSQYGRIVTCYCPVFDSNGKAVGVLGVDIDANQIDSDLRQYLVFSIVAAVIVSALVICLFIYLINTFITHPIMRMAESTSNYVGLMNQNVPPEKLYYEKIRIKRDNEILTLSKGISSLADGVKNYMSNLQSVTAEKERIGAELNVANQIQGDMLPRIFPPFPDRKEFDLYATMTPAKEVGGDFYDFFLIDNDHIALVMADVSGKGVPAALFMVIAKTHIKNRALMGGTPSEILEYANNQLCEGNEAEFFVTVWIAIIEISTGKGVAANAGHEHPVIKRAGGKYELDIYKHSPAVATFEGLKFKEHEFNLNPGDKLFVYTDGVPEATNADGELFGTDRMLDALNLEGGDDPTKTLETVKAHVDEFVGDAPQFDDLTMLAFNYNGPK